MMIERLSARHVVLLGIGHTNAHVLRMWKMNPIPDTDLTCISDFTRATYSGMLPAVLAGQIPARQMEIDLVQLCSSVGARLITNGVKGIDHQTNEVLFANRPPVPFDALSVGIGSTATTDGVNIQSDSFVPIKPMQTFLGRLGTALSRSEQRSEGEPLRVVIVGSGVAGIEITFCLPGFLESASSRSYSLQLITRSDQILPEVVNRTRTLVANEFDRRNVDVLTGKAVTAVDASSLMLCDGRKIDADLVIWATGAAPPTLLGRLGLDLDDRGFVLTKSTLRSTSHDKVFAVGDTGTIVDVGLPKAGVYAVRQGPILWQNLNRLLTGRRLLEYQPQQSFLKLINLGDGRAIGQWKQIAFSGRWVMRLKDSIDSGFIDKFRVVPMEDSMDGSGEDTMQCRGCGCKLGSDVLESALAGASSIVLEDAAEIGGDTPTKLIASTDFFSSPVTDSFLAGRIAALHSASDIIASGAQPTEALANVVLPEGDRLAQQRTVRDFLQGANREFDAMGASVVGGHTIVGPRMEVGFTVIGRPWKQFLVRKCNLKPGDHLYLTKPLGIGVLLAAQMRSICPAEDYEALLEAMFQPQHGFIRAAVDLGIDAGTDVTGFGLVGHLVEMLTTSDVAAVIRLDNIPILPGAVEVVQQGVESSLAPDNRKFEKQVSASEAVRNQAAYRILFDPQTCGGLLLGVNQSVEESFLQATAAIDLPTPVHIGVVIERAPNAPPLTIAAS